MANLNQYFYDQFAVENIVVVLTATLVIMVIGFIFQYVIERKKSIGRFCRQIILPLVSVSLLVF